MVLIHISAENFLRLGLDFVGFSPARQAASSQKNNMQRFFACYGIGPAACSAVFDDLQVTGIEKARVDQPDSQHFLMMLHFLKAYMTETQLSGLCGLSEKTARKHIWKYLCHVQALKGEKITFPDFEQFEEMFVISFDGVHCPINEPRRQPDRRWCSYKLNRAALAYEVALSIHEDRCIWVNGPFRGGTKDLTIFLGEVEPLMDEHLYDVSESVDDEDGDSAPEEHDDEDSAY